jgi:hypothetical protein
LRQDVFSGMVFTMLNSPFLFTHRYDIDMLIHALCTAPAQGLYLNTQTGKVEEQITAPANHSFKLEVLPNSILDELEHHPMLAKTDDTTHSQIKALLKNAHQNSKGLAELPRYFEQGLAGGWLRERIKDYALEWLDGHNLIPPSMRHVPRQTRALNSVSGAKVSIVEP